MCVLALIYPLLYIEFFFKKKAHYYYAVSEKNRTGKNTHTHDHCIRDDER